MAQRPLPLFAFLAVALPACSPATLGFGELGGSDDRGTDTDGETDGPADDDGSEGSDADAGSEDLPGDGDGDLPGDGDGDLPGDGDGDGMLCGDDLVEGSEECDGVDLDGMNCAELNFSGGELGCSPACTFDTSACLSEICGNDIVEGSEKCDGADLGGSDCVALGFGGGQPTCDGSCGYDTSSCSPVGEGDSCWVNSCPNNLHCIVGVCYDGSEGDSCYINNNCLDGLDCDWGTCKP